MFFRDTFQAGSAFLRERNRVFEIEDRDSACSSHIGLTSLNDAISGYVILQFFRIVFVTGDLLKLPIGS